MGVWTQGPVALCLAQWVLQEQAQTLSGSAK